jgi:hypothetical protein
VVDDSALIDKLYDSWWGRHRSTDSMLKGSKNEASVMRTLRRQSWCRSCFAVGLVAMKRAFENCSCCSWWDCVGQRRGGDGATVAIVDCRPRRHWRLPSSFLLCFVIPGAAANFVCSHDFVVQSTHGLPSPQTAW